MISTDIQKDKKLESWIKDRGFAGGGRNRPTVTSPKVREPGTITWILLTEETRNIRVASGKP